MKLSTVCHKIIAKLSEISTDPCVLLKVRDYGVSWYQITNTVTLQRMCIGRPYGDNDFVYLDHQRIMPPDVSKAIRPTWPEPVQIKAHKTRGKPGKPPVHEMRTSKKLATLLLSDDVTEDWVVEQLLPQAISNLGARGLFPLLDSAKVRFSTIGDDLSQRKAPIFFGGMIHTLIKEKTLYRIGILGTDSHVRHVVVNKKRVTGTYPKVGDYLIYNCKDVSAIIQAKHLHHFYRQVDA